MADMENPEPDLAAAAPAEDAGGGRAQAPQEHRTGLERDADQSRLEPGAVVAVRSQTKSTMSTAQKQKPKTFFFHNMCLIHIIKIKI